MNIDFQSARYRGSTGKCRVKVLLFFSSLSVSVKLVFNEAAIC